MQQSAAMRRQRKSLMLDQMKARLAIAAWDDGGATIVTPSRRTET